MNNILLIDDDTDYSILMDLFFKKAKEVDNYEIKSDVTSAIKFLDECENETFPNFIFVDLNMPGLNGFDFFKTYDEYYSEQHKSTSLYVLTSSIRNTDHEKALAFNAVKGILVKPLTRKDLSVILSED